MNSQLFKTCGLDLAAIENKLAEFGDMARFEVEEDCLDARVTMTSDLDAVAFDALRSRIFAEFDNYIYSVRDEQIYETAAQLLKENGRVFAAAESLTAGEVCSMLGRVPGVSANLYEGIVCYDRRSKEQRLGVPHETLEKCGAISAQTAYAMLMGLLDPPVDVAVSTTGLAGPSPDEGKPVGLVYIGVGNREFWRVFECRFNGDRNTVRKSAANMALYYLVRFLKGDIMRLD